MVKLSIDLWDGFEHVSNKTELGLVVIKDITEFIRKRVALELDYGKKLQELCKAVPGAGLFNKQPPIDRESKTLKAALLSWQEEGAKIANHHLEFANKVNNDVIKPLENFVKSKEPERKKLIAEGQKRTKQYSDIKQQHDRAKDTYLKAMKEAEQATEAHDKAKADLESVPENKKKQAAENEKRASQKAVQLVEKGKQAETAYQKAVDVVNDMSKDVFGTQLPPIIDGLQQLEEDRYAQAKTCLETFHKEFRALPDSLIERAEDLLKALEALAVEADLEEFATAHKSNTEPEVFRFVPYKEPQPPAEQKTTTTTEQAPEKKEEEPAEKKEETEAITNAEL